MSVLIGQVGGVGASYTYNAPEELEKFKKIIIDGYDKKSGQEIEFTFESYKEFCEFLETENCGIKICKKESEIKEETKQIILFVKTMKETFIKKYTCIAKYDGVYLNRISNFNGLVFKNAKGDLKDAKVLRELKIDPYKSLEKVYTEVSYFMQAIHSGNLNYGDMKCHNILISKNSEVLIGDYGSIRSYSKLDPSLNQYFYTFRTPCHDEFVEYWISGKGSRFTFTKANPDVFNEKNLKKVLQRWTDLNVLDLPDEDDDDKYEIYAYDYDKFFSKAVDWFHFGIAMIEFITLLQDERLFSYIKPIFEYYCYTPMILDILYPFKIFECIANTKSQKTPSKVHSV